MVPCVLLRPALYSPSSCTTRCRQPPRGQASGGGRRKPSASPGHYYSALVRYSVEESDLNCFCLLCFWSCCSPDQKWEHYIGRGEIRVVPQPGAPQHVAGAGTTFTGTQKSQQRKRVLVHGGGATSLYSGRDHLLVSSASANGSVKSQTTHGCMQPYYISTPCLSDVP